MRMTLAYINTLFPVAFSIMGERFDSDQARAMLMAIALQESGLTHRTQHGSGPARSFWQFETIGIVGLFSNPRTESMLVDACEVLCVSPGVVDVYDAIEHNDVLALICARALLSQVPQRLPERDDPDGGWDQYVRQWRPGRPRRDSWNAHFSTAWQVASPDKAR
jgi:hypothetical protein